MEQRIPRNQIIAHSAWSAFAAESAEFWRCPKHQSEEQSEREQMRFVNHALQPWSHSARPHLYITYKYTVY